MANITFGSYTPSEDENDSTIEIRLGFFFDGTLNNERNTYIRKEKEKKKKGQSYDKEAVKEDPWGFDKDSYMNDYSNVARMYHFYTSAPSIYIEGIGTLNGDTDTVAGYTMGMGATGIREKIRKGCEKLRERLQPDTTVKITVDVYGFSRGAAAARAFVNELTRSSYDANFSRDGYTDLDGYPVDKKRLPARGHLGYLCEKDGIEISNLTVQFVGLYDTVSSYGGNFENDNSSEADKWELGLSAISNAKVKHVVQLAAGHEWRKNFNITTIESTGSKGLELLLPGAHADIGGCYESEVFKQYHQASVTPGRAINDRNTYNALANEKRQPFIDEGWYVDKQITIASHSNKYVNYIGLNGERFIDKRYSYIPLHFMCSLSTEKDSNFNVNGVTEKFKIPEKAGDGTHILHYVKTKLDQYISAVKKAEPHRRKQLSYKSYLDFTNEKILINQYIHWSATGKIGHGPRPNRIRKLIYG
ncbi:DUF2235 domain-containing protein [Chryseobacterium sp. MYb264]|uniref:phospholipase effector Tle1 domain-containing protein n=1 Tax=Chryseobacterium sp. MYb264 TaxID=2745153 RepID=UPI002E0F8650|nr:DUF2235 domain-containing protein [Chryseobacterium sp. MYb264]